MARQIVPEVGKVYRCAATPSGYILVTKVVSGLPIYGDQPIVLAVGWGDAHGHTASHKVVVDWKRLRNTKRSGPFSAVSKERAVDPA